MLEKLNHYRQTLTSPLRQKPSQNQFRFGWVDNLKELQEICKIDVYSILKTISTL